MHPFLPEEIVRVHVERLREEILASRSSGRRSTGWVRRRLRRGEAPGRAFAALAEREAGQ